MDEHMDPDDVDLGLPDLDLDVLGGDDAPGGPDAPLVPAVDEPPDRGGLPDMPDMPDYDPGPADPPDGPEPSPDPTVPPGLGDVTPDIVDLDGEVVAPPHDAEAPAAPVDLPLDEPLDGPSPEPLAPSGADEVDTGVDLTLDDELVVPDDEQPDTPDAGVDLGVDDLAPVAAGDGNAWLTGGIVAAALTAAGLVGPRVARVLGLRRATPPDLAAHLDGIGIDARVEHLDLLGLEALLREGRTVLLSVDGQAGVDETAVVQLESVARDAQQLHLRRGDGSTTAIDLAAFEEAWADSANQVVLATGPEGRVALVPVELAGV